jgi:hypothetical protein
MHAHTTNKQKDFKQSFSAKELMATLFWERNGADGGINARRDHNNVRSVLRNTKNCVGPFRKKRRGMLITGEVLPHDNALPHTAGRTLALLEHFNWELSDHLPYRPDIAPSDYHLFTYLKNWLGSLN